MKQRLFYTSPAVFQTVLVFFIALLLPALAVGNRALGRPASDLEQLWHSAKKTSSITMDLWNKQGILQHNACSGNLACSEAVEMVGSTLSPGRQGMLGDAQGRAAENPTAVESLSLPGQKDFNALDFIVHIAPTGTLTATMTFTATSTSTATNTPSASPTRTRTAAPSPTKSPTITFTPSKTPTPTPSKSPTWTLTPTRTPFPPPVSPTSTPSETPTITASATLTPTATQTPSATLLPLPTLQYTLEPTATASPTSSPTPTALTIPSITPNNWNQAVDALFEPANSLRVRLVLLVISLWASLATGIYLYIRRNR